MEIYVPSDYFEFNLAKQESDKIKVMGLFKFVVYPDINDRKPKSGSVHRLHIPCYVQFQYHEMFKAKDILGEDKGNYVVYVLEKGDIFIDSVDVEQQVETAKDFITKFHTGKIPNNTPYDDVYKMYIDATSIHKADLEVPSVLIETEIAELYRSKNNDYIPFRLVLNKNPNTSKTDYHNINISQLPGIKGTFQSMMFENIRSAVHQSILNTKTGVEEVETPLEEIARL